MSVESSFFKDRPPEAKELRDLPDSLPSVTFPREYDDIFRVDAAMDIEQVSEEEFRANLTRWYFRMN